MKVKSESEVAQSCPTLCDPIWSVGHKAPLSMGFSRQDYWSGLALPSPKRRLRLEKKVMTKLDNILESRDINYCASEDPSSQGYGLSIMSCMDVRIGL